MKKTWVETPVFQVEELANIEEEVQDCFHALTREVNKNSAQLTASSNQVIPPYSRAYLQVACPQKLVRETMLVEPEALSNGLVIGGVCIQADKRNDHYLPVMNLSDTEEIIIRRGQLICYAMHIVDDRVLIGLDETMTEAEYYQLREFPAREADGASAGGIKYAREKFALEAARVGSRGVKSPNEKSVLEEARVGSRGVGDRKSVV